MRRLALILLLIPSVAWAPNRSLLETVKDQWSAARTTLERWNQIVQSDDFKCMSLNVYYEARGEPYDGQVAVASVVNERTRNNEHWQGSHCKVIYEKGQFSWTVQRKPAPRLDSLEWGTAQLAAFQVLRKGTPPAFRGLVFFHARKVRWSPRNGEFEMAVGNHVFYSLKHRPRKTTTIASR